jgi:hypothetical protein
MRELGFYTEAEVQKAIGDTLKKGPLQHRYSSCRQNQRGKWIEKMCARSTIVFALLSASQLLSTGLHIDSTRIRRRIQGTANLRSHD